MKKILLGMNYDLNRKDAFMRAFENRTSPESPLHPDVRCLDGMARIEIFPSVGYMIDLRPNEVYLCEFRTYEQRRGHGHRAMSLLTNLADEFEIHVYLDAVPQEMGAQTITPGHLKRFYQSHNFYATGDGNRMYRMACPYEL